MRRPIMVPVPGIETIPAPSCMEQANVTLQELAATSRRSFLGRGLAAAAVPATLAVAASGAQAAKPKNTKKNTKEETSPFPTYFAGSTLRNFQEIQTDEATHVQILIDAIKSLGGTPRPYPTFTGITVSDPATFLQLAVAFENTGVHAYFGAAPYIENKNVLAVAASIAFVEAYHSGFLNTLANQPLIPGGLTYATPYTVDQVVAAVSPYITSFNDPQNLFPPTFSTTPSPQNDIAILNFALIAEYLEATFYFNSVPRVFA